MVTSTVENYLKMILVRSGDADGVVSTTAISEPLGVTPGTVTTMVKSLVSQGLVERRSAKRERLTSTTFATDEILRDAEAAYHLFQKHVPGTTLYDAVSFFLAHTKTP